MDSNALRALLALNGKKTRDLEQALGISKSALYRKMNGESDFTRKEIGIIISYLGIKDPMAIFFKEEVS